MAALATLVAAPVAVRAAAPDRASALAGWRAVQQDERVAAGWTGSTAGCVIGTESPASLAATLRTVNVTFQAPRVTVAIDGDPVPVTNVRPLGDGYGSAHTLAWQVAVDGELTAADHTVVVTVQGAVVDGQPLAPIVWTTYAFQPFPRFVARPRIRRPGGVAATRPRAGQRLVASATVTGGTVTRYRWLRHGRVIGAAKRSEYRVKQRDRGHALSVRLTATAPSGGPETVETSAPVH